MMGRPKLHSKFRADNPMSLAYNLHSMPAICGAFTIILFKTLALSPKTCYGGGFHAHKSLSFHCSPSSFTTRIDPTDIPLNRVYHKPERNPSGTKASP